VTLADLGAHKAQRREALSVAVKGATLYNFPPPTQGLASLMILAIFERLGIKEAETFEYLHGIVEATKQAFLVRDRVVGDPAYMAEQAEHYLTPEILDELASRVSHHRALPWPVPVNPGDTVWLGAIDKDGIAVSFIQSIYFEFGSGCVLENSGIIWQTAARASCSMPTARAHCARAASRSTPSILQWRYSTTAAAWSTATWAAKASQSQSAVFSRYAMYGQGLQAAITAPRWLLGKTWGDATVTLKLEDRFDPAVVQAMRDIGHDIEILPAFTSTMGHAGAVVRHPDGMFEGATDPRSDGAAMGF
jgi:gamma-glutamyltranspeptidase/glutathione hydrolase